MMTESASATNAGAAPLPPMGGGVAGMGMADAMTGETERLRASPLKLLAQAVGAPSRWPEKTRRLARSARLWASGRELERRMANLAARGLVPAAPTRNQLLGGGLDMLRFFIVPGARDYYRQRGINFHFHQLLRVLEDPVSMVDPVGFLSERDTIIGHVMQVVHADPIYDLQLLQMFEDGLAELESQVAAMVAGTHPRAATIGAIVEDPEYHGRLLAYVRAYRQSPDADRLVRSKDEIANDPEYALAEKTFATLPSFLRYAAALPVSTLALVRHLATTKRLSESPPLAKMDDARSR